MITRGRIRRAAVLAAGIILLATASSCVRPLSFGVAPFIIAPSFDPLHELLRNRLAIFLVANQCAYLSENEIQALPGVTFVIDDTLDCDSVVPHGAIPRYCLTGISESHSSLRKATIDFDDIVAQRDCVKLCSELVKVQSDRRYSYDAVEPIGIYLSLYPDSKKPLFELDFVAYPPGPNRTGMVVQCIAVSRVSSI
ncbi:MAG TPA: hypothetical protein VJZ71_20695 [Phycisphaerae bacterium]|nr:hypothetical protein [Phycisphaerae bacterium]